MFKFLNLVFCFYILLIIGWTACEVHDVNELGAFVPPTTDQDWQLPQMTIEVAGKERSIHLQAFGERDNPVVFVLHGGPGADFRLLLPLKALAEAYYVVMWDSRGAGLSERVAEDELSIDSFNEEISQIKNAIAPGKRVILIGHSFGANVMIKFAANHPSDVEQLILIEPGKLDLSLNAKSNGGSVNFLDGQDFFWQNELLTSSDHATADYKAVELLPKSGRNWTCDGALINDYPFWRFGSYHYTVVQRNTFNLADDFSWAEGIEGFKGDISIISGTCGALGDAFQRKTNLKTLPTADFITIPGAGHISLFTDYAEETVHEVKKLLE